MLACRCCVLVSTYIAEDVDMVRAIPDRHREQYCDGDSCSLMKISCLFVVAACKFPPEPSLILRWRFLIATDNNTAVPETGRMLKCLIIDRVFCTSHHG